MNLSEIWIRRPVMTVLVMVSILFFGITSYLKLPINGLPSVDYPVIQVTAELPGASPEIMAATVATPLEKEFAKIDGMEAMTSSNGDGSSNITLTFKMSKNIDAAAQDVNTAIAAAKSNLPEEMPSAPTYSKINPAAQPIMYYVLTSRTIPMPQVQDYAETFMSTYLSTISGVAKVEIMGAQKPAVRIKLNPDILAARGLGLNDVTDALKKGNVNKPGGSLNGPFAAISLDSNGQLKKAVDYNSLIVAYKNGSPLRIDQLGTAVDSVENERVKLWLETPTEKYESIILAISKQPGANAVQIAKDVKEKMPELKKSMPQAVQIELVYDESNFIRDSIYDVQFTLLLTIMLVIAVIFFFIRAAKPTLIPAIAVPFSLVATFCCMYVMGFSLNNLSLMALTLSVGFVVDDAIVMMENIIRRMEAGEDALTASLRGSREIGFTILSMTLSLVVVFVPILFMEGLLGKLFREFAVSIAVAILISGFISLTLTPMMCSMILQNKEDNTSRQKQQRGRLYHYSEQIYDKALSIYARSLQVVFAYRRFVLLFIVLIMLASVGLVMIIDKGFIPSQDSGYFQIVTQAEDRASFDYMVQRQEKVNDILRAEPSIRAIFSVVGYPANNSGFIFVLLQEREKREAGVDQIIAKLRTPLNAVTGIQSIPFNPPPISAAEGGTNGIGEYRLKSSNLAALQQYTKIMEDKLKSMPGLTDVNSDLKMNKQKINIVIDRDKAYAMGLNFSDIQDAFYSAYGSRSVSTIYGDNTQYKVYVELLPDFQRQPSSLERLYIQSDVSKALIPLSTVAQFKEKLVPVTINHSGQIPAATISFNLQEGYSLDRAISEIQQVARVTLPENVTGELKGTSESMEAAFASFAFLLVVTVFVIYVVLGILYESFIHPLTILSALPLAGFGALLALVLCRMELDIYSLVGIIMLAGLVKKNGIMMIDFALQAERQEGMSAEQSIHKACMIRFRPIMMTTMAAIFGALPIALGLGAGGESRQPMGVAVVGGLIFSQLLTLYVTPVFYIYLDKLSKKFSWLHKT